MSTKSVLTTPSYLEIMSFPGYHNVRNRFLALKESRIVEIVTLRPFYFLELKLSDRSTQIGNNMLGKFVEDALQCIFHFKDNEIVYNASGFGLKRRGNYWN